METEHCTEVGTAMSARRRRKGSSKIRLRNTTGWFDKLVTGDQVDSGHTGVTARLAVKPETETGAKAS